jgi:hypothetical protein
MVGFRFQVGMDWNNYLSLYNVATDNSLTEQLLNSEPGYRFLEWAAARSGLGYPLINAVSGLAFCWGLFAVARTLREPLLGIVIATPLLVVAFAMSGTRQALAMGIVYYLFSTWDRRGFLARGGFVLLASMFHASAMFVLIFVALAARVSLPARIATAVGSAVLMLLIIYLSPGLIQNYGELYVVAGGRKLDAPGAIAQVAAVAAPAVAYFLIRDRWLRVNGHNLLYENLAIAAILALPAIFISSVGAYRFALYFWPMAMYVIAGMPALIERSANALLYRFVVVLASTALLVGWLNLSYNGSAWLPYQNWLLQPENARLRR